MILAIMKSIDKDDRSSLGASLDQKNESIKLRYLGNFTLK